MQLTLEPAHDTFNIRTHNGIVTIENPHRGTHRTFRIRTQQQDAKFKPGSRIVSLLTGPSNTTGYTQLGEVTADGIRLWRRYNTPHYRSLVRVLLDPVHFQGLGAVYHIEGRCRVCNRLLTTPESIRQGIGPVCQDRE